MAQIDSTFNKLAAQRSFVVHHRPGKKKRQYTAAMANPAVQELIVMKLDVTHAKLSEVIHWLRTNAEWDGRAPAGFDTHKKSWGSAARRHFWADGSKIVIQGVMRSTEITGLYIYLAPELASQAMLLKLTMG